MRAHLCDMRVIAALALITTLVASRTAKAPFDPDKYLERFGYLGKRPTGVQHDPDTRTHAIRNFQRMAGLPLSGNLDHDTREKMKAPRCGMPDVIPEGNLPPTGVQYDPSSGQHSPVNYYVPGYKWAKNTLTWKANNWSSDMSWDSQRRAFYEAFGVWNAVSPMNFQEIGSGTPDIQIEFAYGEHSDGPGNGFDGEGGILAHAYYPEDGDTHFDEAETWTEYSEEGTNLMIVSAHEFGHALGLGHSSINTALMAPFYQGYESNFKLHEDDIQAIQSLYGLPDSATTTTTQSPGPTTTKKASTGGSGKPDTCTTKFDAILQAHDAQVYMFKGKYIWRVDDYYGVNDGFPILIRKIYDHPPQNIGSAVYSWRTRYTYFFKSNKVFKYYGFERIERRLMNTSTWPATPSAAFMGRDGRIYILSGSMSYVFDEYTMELDSSDSPQPISTRFPGVPDRVESAVRLRDGYVYFFKGLKYRKYDEYNQKVLPGYPKPTHPAWMGPPCGGDYSPK